MTEEKIRAIVRAEMEDFALELSDRLWARFSQTFGDPQDKVFGDLSIVINDMFEPNEEVTEQ